MNNILADIHNLQNEPAKHAGTKSLKKDETTEFLLWFYTEILWHVIGQLASLADPFQQFKPAE